MICPCGSLLKYKKCCQPYHSGLLPVTALELMKSRYSAYAKKKSQYIIQTTHPDNPDYTTDTKAWQESIDEFCEYTDFVSLEILEFIDGESEAYVTFKAQLDSGSMIEKSRFLKVQGRWLYESGEFR